MSASNFDRELAEMMATPTPPINVGYLSAKTCNEWVNEAFKRPNPESLWRGMWYEGEVCCLFADSNLGKSILAVQIGTEIAQRKTVLYFDFELSDKQFQLRYTDGNDVYKFPQNLIRVEVNREAISNDFEDVIINDIETMTLKHGANVLIVDNITWMSSESEKGRVAADLMKKLVGLKFKYGWSLLVIAHTPKRNMSNPISQNDLAGSKMLFNFFDSVFAIGQSAKDNSLRYIKQIKCRYGEFTYNADNVMVCSIEKRNAFTEFVVSGYATEREHLRERTADDEAELSEKIKELAETGMSYRNIATELGTSAAKVCRVLKHQKGVSGVSVRNAETGETNGTSETGETDETSETADKSVSGVSGVLKRNNETAKQKGENDEI